MLTWMLVFSTEPEAPCSGTTMAFYVMDLWIFPTGKSKNNTWPGAIIHNVRVRQIA